MAPRLVEGALPGTKGAFSGVLPSVAGPFSPGEAEALWARLEAVGGSRGPFGGGLFLQPPLEDVAPLPVEEAERIALAAIHEEYAKEYEGEALPSHSWVGAFEFPRCWAFLFYQGDYIPPGIGVLVDRHSRSALTLRWVDVDGELRELGYDTDPAPGQGLTLRPPGSRRLPTRAELTSDTERFVRQEDALYTEPDGTRIRVEVWADQVCGVPRELDVERKRYRSGPSASEAPGPWRPYRE